MCLKKSFITDCEGPLTLNDNALSYVHFRENGDGYLKFLVYMMIIFR